MKYIPVPELARISVIKECNRQGVQDLYGFFIQTIVMCYVSLLIRALNGSFALVICTQT